MNLKVNAEVDLAGHWLGGSDLLEHMTRALVENACKSTERGSVTLLMHWDHLAKTLVFTVADTSQGINKTKYPRLYEDVVSVSSNKDSRDIGLGPAIC